MYAFLKWNVNRRGHAQCTLNAYHTLRTNKFTYHNVSADFYLNLTYHPTYPVIFILLSSALPKDKG